MFAIEFLMEDTRMRNQLNMLHADASEISSEIGSGHGNEIYAPSNSIRIKSGYII